MTLLASGLSVPVALSAERAESSPVGATGVAAQVVEDLTGELDASALARRLVGDGVSVENVTYTGDERGAGAFSGFGDVFGFDAGISLSSGAIASDRVEPSLHPNLPGPNVYDGPGPKGEAVGTSAAFGTPGDADLDELSDPFATLDAAVLEFDFVPNGPAVSFNYVFGSEEYLEFVSDPFNDVFAFYVNEVNCATVPDGAGGQVPVTVDTVNDVVNPQLFRSNTDPEHPDDPKPFNTELDGFTTVLTCTANVNQGQTNHLKLAIADVTDEAFDSSVVIEKDSLAVAAADLSVDLTASPPDVTAGTEVVFDATVGNAGPAAALDATFDLTLPAGVEATDLGPLPDGWTCQPLPAVSCTNPQVDPGLDPVTFTVTALVSPGTLEPTLTATAEVGSTVLDPNDENSTDSASFNVFRSADLVAHLGAPATGLAGQPIDFVVTVDNLGPSSATEVVGTLSTDDFCKIASIAPGTPGTCIVRVTFEDEGEYVVSVVVDGTEDDPIGDNNEDSVTIVIGPSSDLGVDVIRPAEPLHAGDAVTWSATVTNSGPSAAANATYDLTLSPDLLDLRDLTYPDDWECGITESGVHCDQPGLPAGAVSPISVTGTLAPGQPVGTLTATGTVDSDSTDTIPENDVDSEVIGTDRLVDLSGTLGGDDTVLVNQTIKLTAPVLNKGPSIATDVRATLSTGEFVELGTIGPGKTANAIFELSFDTVGEVTVVVTVAAVEPDSDDSNNRASKTITVLPSADLSVDLLAPAEMVAGAPAQWAATITNIGPTDANDATFDLQLPGALTFVADAPWACAPTDTGLRCDATLLPLGTANISVTTTMPPDTPAGTITGVATVGSAVADVEPDNNSDVDSAPLERQADVSVLDFTVQGPAYVGQAVPASATVQNSGPSTATDVTFTLTTGDTINVGTLNPGEIVEVPFTLTFDTVGPIAVTLSASALELDPDPPDNSATVVIDVLRSADLGVVLEAPAGPVDAGAPAEWVATVTNDGPTEALDVTVDFELDVSAELSDIDAPGWSCDRTETGLQCLAAALESGFSDTIELTATTLPETPAGRLTGTVTIASPDKDFFPDNNSEAKEVTLERHADLSVELVGPQSGLVGEEIKLQAIVTNNGPSSANDTTAELSTGETFELDTLAPGETTEVETDVAFDVAGAVAVSASVTANEEDTEEENNRSSIAVDITALELTLAPDDTTSLIGSEFVPSAVVTAGGDPVAGAVVDFQLSTLAQAARDTSVTTDANGVASFPYTRDAVGTDQLRARVTVRGVEATDQITHTWETALNGLAMEIGPEGATTPVGDEFAVTVLVTDNDGPVVDALVQLSATIPGSPQGEAAVLPTRTNSTGTATFRYTQPVAGIETVVATIADGERTGEASMAHIWSLNDLTVTLGPDGATTEVGGEFRATLTALTDDGDPVVGARVEFIAGGDGLPRITDEQTTDAAGQAVVTIRRDQAGTEAITALVTMDAAEGTATIAHQWVFSAAAAQECLHLGQSAVTPGGQVTAAGTGTPGAEVRITLDSQPFATTTIGDDGTYELPLDLPMLAIGKYSIGASCGPIDAPSDPLHVVGIASQTGTAAAAVTTTATILLFFIFLIGPLARLGSSAELTSGL